MAISFIKYFAITMVSLFVYIKILNVKDISKTRIALSIIFSAFLSLAMFWLRIIIPEISIFIMVISTGIFIIALNKTQTEIVLTSTIISYGLSFVFFLLASIITIFLSKLIFGYIANDLLIVSISFLIQIFFAKIPFMFKRLRNGIPFLTKKKFVNFGVTVSLVLLCMCMYESDFEGCRRRNSKWCRVV